MSTHRRIPRVVIGLALLAAVNGCALPDYHLPSGFSSTYYRHLQQSQVVVQAQAMEPMVTETAAPVQSRWWHWLWAP